MLNHRRGECTPHGRGFALQVAAPALAAIAALVPSPGLAEAAPPRDDALAENEDLDGDYVALGPRGGAVFSEGRWDGAFGAEAFVYRYREDRPVSVLGAAGGWLQLSEIDGGQAFGEIGAGTQLGLGSLVGGASVGVTARLSPVRHTRWGAHATLWAFAGAVPYARAGLLQDTGMFVDFGVRLALPALRW